MVFEGSSIEVEHLEKTVAHRIDTECAQLTKIRIIWDTYKAVKLLVQVYRYTKAIKHDISPMQVLWVPAELKLQLIEIEFCKTQIAVYLPWTFMGCIPMCL